MRDLIVRFDFSIIRYKNGSDEYTFDSYQPDMETASDVWNRLLDVFDEAGIGVVGGIYRVGETNANFFDKYDKGYTYLTQQNKYAVIQVRPMPKEWEGGKLPGGLNARIDVIQLPWLYREMQEVLVAADYAPRLRYIDIDVYAQYSIEMSLVSEFCRYFGAEDTQMGRTEDGFTPLWSRPYEVFTRFPVAIRDQTRNDDDLEDEGVE